MSWLTILIIVMVVSMMIGPIMWLKPSRRQQTLALLRSKAQKLGLVVSMVPLNGVSIACYRQCWRQKTDKQNRLIITFEGRFERKDYEHELHIAGVWSLDGHQPLSSELRSVLDEFAGRLPKSVMAFEVSKIGLGVFWREFGGEECLDELASLLSEFEPKVSSVVHSRSPIEY